MDLTEERKNQELEKYNLNTIKKKTCHILEDADIFFHENNRKI